MWWIQTRSYLHEHRIGKLAMFDCFIMTKKKALYSPPVAFYKVVLVRIILCKKTTSKDLSFTSIFFPKFYSYYQLAVLVGPDLYTKSLLINFCAHADSTKIDETLTTVGPLLTSLVEHSILQVSGQLNLA
jgi:hypothetical protein